MDVSFVNPFLKATDDTFKTMLNVELAIGAPTLKKDAKHAFDVSGVIGLSGEAQGLISVSFPRDIAFKVVSTLIGAEVKEVGAELIDGIGEIANIIAGNAKQYLTEYNLSISLPNVVVGADHRIEVQSGIPTIIVPLSSPIGDFAMEVALKTK
ncbi:MAG: chemotaxis protein CheX [Chitinivibrionales bacterium]|nr:chemotaxis protein CheX [Chitinivibrionales bacterium]